MLKEEFKMLSTDTVSLSPNPLVQALRKPPKEFSKADIIGYIEDNRIPMLNLRYVGGDGRLKTLNFAIQSKAHLDRVLTLGERVDGSSLFTFVDATSSDLYVVPRLSTAFLSPFSTIPTLEFLCGFYDVDGKNKMDKQNGCVFTATQNLYAQTTKDDQAESGYQADAVIDAYQKSSDFTNVSFEPTKDDSTLVKDTDGHAIETKRLDFTYTGADHKDYKLTRVVRVFSTVGRPVMLQGMYACPVNVYSSSEMEELFKATPISNPGPADMDEGSSSDGAGKDGNDGKKSESEAE